MNLIILPTDGTRECSQYSIPAIQRDSIIPVVVPGFLTRLIGIISLYLEAGSVDYHYIPSRREFAHGGEFD